MRGFESRPDLMIEFVDGQEWIANPQSGKARSGFGTKSLCAGSSPAQASTIKQESVLESF